MDRPGRLQLSARVPWPVVQSQEGLATMAQPTILFAAKPVTVIALLTIAENAPMALAEYLRVTAPLLERAGARITKRFQISEMVAGTAPAQSVLMVEYPSRAAVDQVFNSPEYKSIIPIRDKAFLTYQVSIVTD